MVTVGESRAASIGRMLGFAKRWNEYGIELHCTRMRVTRGDREVEG